MVSTQKHRLLVTISSYKIVFETQHTVRTYKIVDLLFIFDYYVVYVDKQMLSRYFLFVKASLACFGQLDMLFQE